MQRKNLQRLTLGAFLCLAFTTACSGHRGAASTPRLPSPGKKIESGLASWYGPKYHGRQTANGETFDMDTLTAAHKKLPFGTVVDVVRKDTGRSVRVRINDRGPFIRGRIIDLSRRAAEEIELIGVGVTRVDLILVSGPGPPRARRAPAASNGPKEPNEAALFIAQAGAFEEGFRAEALSDRLRAAGFDARVEIEDGWARVRIGEWTSRTEAEAILQTLRGAGFEGRLASRQTPPP